jgi:Ran GTPase-activating protein (RanGAP) involved in mRNA processing and transport
MKIEELKKYIKGSSWNLSGKKLTDDDAKLVANYTKANSSLKELWLYNNQIGDSGGKAIGEALKTNSSLTWLWLSNNQIGNSGGKFIIEGLKRNTAITYFDFSGNKISSELSDELQALVFENKNNSSKAKERAGKYLELDRKEEEKNNKG